MDAITAATINRATQHLQRCSPVTLAKSQTGYSLVGFLIGTVISLLCTLASLNVYTNHYMSARELINDSEHDRQLTLSMVSSQKLVVNAGYGIPNADGDDVKRVFVPSGADPASISLLWRYSDGAVVTCQGLHESSVTRDGKEFRTLNIIGSTADCDATSPLEGFAWAEVQGVLGQWPVKGGLADYIVANDTMFDFQIDPADCSPYGVLQSDRHLVVTLTVPSGAELNGATSVVPYTSQVCLANTYPI